MAQTNSTSIIADMVAQEIATRERTGIQGPIVEPIGNLAYCTPDVRSKVEAVLANDSVRFTVKAIIRDGLNRDCLDATRDAILAAGMLELVSNSILG